MENKGEIVIYQNKDNDVSLNVRLEDENVWLTQANLVDLYQSSKANVSEHIKHIFEEGELDGGSVVRKFRTTAADGKNENLKSQIAISTKYPLSRVAFSKSLTTQSILCSLQTTRTL